MVKQPNGPLIEHALLVVSWSSLHTCGFNSTSPTKLKETWQGLKGSIPGDINRALVLCLWSSLPRRRTSNFGAFRSLGSNFKRLLWSERCVTSLGGPRNQSLGTSVSPSPAWKRLSYQWRQPLCKRKPPFPSRHNTTTINTWNKFNPTAMPWGLKYRQDELQMSSVDIQKTFE